MTWVTWTLVLLIPLEAYLAFQLGRRHQKGQQEAEADRREDESYQRGIRGTVKLSTMKIRR